LTCTTKLLMYLPHSQDAKATRQADCA